VGSAIFAVLAKFVAGIGAEAHETAAKPGFPDTTLSVARTKPAEEAPIARVLVATPGPAIPKADLSSPAPRLPRLTTRKSEE